MTLQGFARLHLLPTHSYVCVHCCTVLDECQVIKNARTLAAHAAWCLKARHRWCLSGTPMQNSADDLYPLFKFLKYDPYSKASTFKELIRDAINGSKPELGYQRLQTVLLTCMLRRTKNSKIDGQPVVALPERRVVLEQQEFSTPEREFYKKLEEEASQKMKVRAGRVSFVAGICWGHSWGFIDIL
jgi:SNF2 family DNA or RNA helicase